MSDLLSAVQDYLCLRRSLGFKLTQHGSKLNDFAVFMEKQGAPAITTRLALAWAQQRSDLHPSSQAQLLGVVRGFARYYSASCPETEVPPHGLLPGHHPRRIPHLYADEDIRRLMDAARCLRVQNGMRAEDALRPWTYSTMLGLFAVTGLRFGEVLRLEREDVDLSRALLTVNRTKFGKSRLVPLHETTVAALQRYTTRRDRLHPTPLTPHFFVGQCGGSLDQRTVKTMFIRLSRQVGLRGVADHHGPRIHDFRHSFAVKTVVRWYEEGADVGQRMPTLSTFLGHTHMADTYWYLSASPRLLALAGARLERLLEEFS